MPTHKKDDRTGAAAAALTATEVAVARRLADLTLTDRPFARIGAEIGLSEAEVLAIADGLRERGVIRKFGAIARHQLAGYRHNVMVLWAVPPAQCAAVGERLARFPEITHCYERLPAFEGKYTLFTMVHFHEEADAARLREIAAVAEGADFKVLRSSEEFKKISMEYF
ncbi:MAG: Lrp/AsnC family transcriptional regulator [Deltaproteobacteria bacterium]|nr:Lrp/AsnC family transcriptional regulator [Deltaproteobacteria bacterium]